jgi:predicted AlkP superfamily phosphohydrolase/phosphomutase
MFNYVYGGVRLNLAGREPRGCIQPGAEQDAFCDQLAADLKSLVDVDQGRPVVRRVMRTADFYEGPYLHDLPDLLIEWDTDFYPRAIHSPKTGTIPNDLFGPRTGDHRMEGLICASGPGVSPGRVEAGVSVADIAPTLAALAGVPLPNVDGRPIAAIVPVGIAR